jgi:hypothetical protein
MNIQILPKSKRAKERVKQHGSIFELIKEDVFQGENGVYVKSQNVTASDSTFWHGWFRKSEADFVKIKD